MVAKKKSQTKKALPKTRKTKSQPQKVVPRPQEIKQITPKIKLTLCPSLLLPIEGLQIYAIEREGLIHIVALSDLRKLFIKRLPGIAAFIEQSNPLELGRFIKVCPDYYKKIFTEERLTRKISTIKNLYPAYYNFISTFSINEVTTEEFKEQYSKVLLILNCYIEAVISTKEKINLYYSKEGTMNKELVKSNNAIIENMEWRLFNLPEKSTTEAIKPKVETKIKLKVISPKVDKFVWLKSKDALECLFDDLSEEGYIKDYSKVLLRQHFTIKNEHNPLIDTKGKEEYKRINWNSKNTNLIVLIFQLRLDGSIFFTGDRYHKMAFDHFDKDGNDLNMTSLKSAKSQITNKRTGYIDKPIFQELRNLIKRNKHP